jgi:type VI secretion system protein ImpC
MKDQGYTESDDWPFGEYSLAVVVFTDVVGFSLRAGENERKALECLQRDFRLISPIVKRFHGHLLKTMGDGQLLCFQSATNAVHCAISIQLALMGAAESLPPEDVFQHRIGIHLGDVFLSGADVNGNGVNIASRLQGKAEPGGICISQSVYDVVRHLQSIQVNYLGPQDLKNIRDAVPIYQILLDVAHARERRGEPQPERPSERAPNAGLTASVALRSHPGKTSRCAADEPFRIVVVGDFSGRASRGLMEPWIGRTVETVDLDSFEKRLARVELQIPRLERPDEGLTLKFKSLEDFHPDRFARKSDVLLYLLDLRRRMDRADPAAEAELEAMFRLIPENPGAGRRTNVTAIGQEVDTIVRGLFGDNGPNSCRFDELFTLLDEELARQVRSILSHADFKRLEAAWTSLSELVDRFGEEDQVHLHMCDVSKEEFVADLCSETAPGGALRSLLDRGPWAMIVGNFSFASTPREIAALEVAAGICAEARAPLVAAADPSLAGCEAYRDQPDPDTWHPAIAADCRDRWLALRASPRARFLALAAPRYLLRLPYSDDNDPIELFPFDELPSEGGHEFLLWGNPAFLVARVVAEAFLTEGWALRTARSAAVDERPVHRREVKGETAVTPFAEAWLTERAAAVMLERGVIPLVSDRSRDRIRIPMLQSIASLPQPLAGPWSSD